MTLNTKVVSAKWDALKQVYHITLQDVTSGNTRQVDSEIVISAVGVLEDPRYPSDMEGIKDFKGELFHSARWNHGIDLKGKRVAVIGNGC